MKRRQRHLLRVDIVAAVLVAVIVCVSAPGLAIVALAALSTLAVCTISMVTSRRRSR